MAERRREVRFPNQVKPMRLYAGRVPKNAEAMWVGDSIREQLGDYALRRLANDPRRRNKIFKFNDFGIVNIAMMRTVNLPDGDWSDSKDR